MLAIADFGDGAFHRTEPVTLERVQSVLRRLSESDVTLKAVHMATSWTDRAQQATTYRNGRVLLAGDAAHIHSPLGGQGLNLGLGDALNLGWKLAATVKGIAPDELLDTYTAERHPVGAQVLEWSRAQVDIMRPGPHAHAMESVIRDLMNTGDGNTYFAERVWGTTLRYNLGVGHPLIGRGAPDFAYANGVTVGSLMREGTGILLDFDSRGWLKSPADRWSGRIKYVSGASQERLSLSSVLIRPDGFVAWACNGECDESEVFAEAARWFGMPTGEP